MKILNIENIRKGDTFTIENEPISSIDLMERASSNCSNWIADNFTSDNNISVFSGPGNNGGDGLAIARILKSKGYIVKVFIVEYTTNYSEDFKINLKRLQELDIEIKTLNNSDYNIIIESNTIIIDSIFGSGLSREISGFAADIINQINNNRNTVISIDIASGLFADKLNDNKNQTVIKPNHTLSISFPKLAFFLSENSIYVGNWHHIDIGIHSNFISEVKPIAYYIQKEDIIPLLKTREKYSHKGNYGHALLIAGSYGKIGAAVLAARAALKTGLGLLTTHIPYSAVNIIQTAIPESMLSIDENEKTYSNTPELNNYNAIGIGPGLGTSKLSQLAFKLLIQNTSKAMLIDADALNILSENKTWLAFLPKNSILTPHPKEFERLIGKTANSYERIEKQKELSIKHNIIIVLKGANTSISSPNGQLFINSSGNPGMATAGSGDVLSGIILSLLAQNYNPIEAALIGCYLHGLAGDIAAYNLGFESLIASNITENISEAFLSLQV